MQLYSRCPDRVNIAMLPNSLRWSPILRVDCGYFWGRPNMTASFLGPIRVAREMRDAKAGQVKHHEWLRRFRFSKLLESQVCLLAQGLVQTDTSRNGRR